MIRVVPENYEFGKVKIKSPSGNPIYVYDLERRELVSKEKVMLLNHKISDLAASPFLSTITKHTSSETLISKYCLLRFH